MQPHAALNGGFLGFLGFLGCLGFLGFHDSEQYRHLTSWSWLALPALLSLLVLIPRHAGKIKTRIAAGRRHCLFALVFLVFLSALAGPRPQLANLSFLAFIAMAAIDTGKRD